MRKKMLLFLAAGLLLAAEAPKDDAVKKELERMQGDWVLVSGERDGKQMPEDQVKALRRTTKGDHFTLTRNGETVSKGTFKVDPTKKPRTIDILREEGADKGTPILGIYELDGDNYKICYGGPGKERPSEFSAKEGSGQTLSVWKREKK